MTNYQDALRIVTRLPRIGRLETSDSKSGRKRRRWVVRPFVRIFVESHIRSKVDVIVTVLNLETSPLIDEASNETQKIKSWTRQLRAFSKRLRGWAGSFGLLTRAPLMTALLPLFGAFLTQMVGISFSNWESFGTSIAKLGQSAPRASIVASLKLVALMLLYCYMLFSTVVVGFGFRGKRAIFSGGETEPDFSRRDMFTTESSVEVWDRIPNTNIYHAENELFKTLRIEKTTEFPLDIVASFTPYFVLVILIVFAVGLVLKMWAGQRPSFWQFFFLLVLLLLTVDYIYSGVSSYRERIKRRNV